MSTAFNFRQFVKCQHGNHYFPKAKEEEHNQPSKDVQSALSQRETGSISLNALQVKVFNDYSLLQLLSLLLLSLLITFPRKLLMMDLLKSKLAPLPNLLNLQKQLPAQCTEQFKSYWC